MTKATLFLGAWIGFAALSSCNGGAPPTDPGSRSATTEKSEDAGVEPEKNMSETATTEIATFGAGCFWCVEAVFERIEGVQKVESGYMGGKTENPTYKDICTGTTGHAEVVQLTFNPSVVSFEKLVAWFWKLHDPTTLNRQGADVGTQYRSAIFYHSAEQKAAAERSRKAEDDSGQQPGPIVTEITAASKFYVAENYHQEFFELNKFHPYCQAVIAPKLDKLGFDR